MHKPIVSWPEIQLFRQLNQKNLPSWPVRGSPSLQAPKLTPKRVETYTLCFNETSPSSRKTFIKLRSHTVWAAGIVWHNAVQYKRIFRSLKRFSPESQGKLRIEIRDSDCVHNGSTRTTSSIEQHFIISDFTLLAPILTSLIHSALSCHVHSRVQQIEEVNFGSCTASGFICVSYL